MSIKLICAISKNNVIGNENKLPWNISEDLKRFKELTTNNWIVMGRKTFDSIGRPLPNRKNIVLSKNKNLTDKIIDGSVLSESESNLFAENVINRKINDYEIVSLLSFLFQNGEKYEEIFAFVKLLRKKIISLNKL